MLLLKDIEELLSVVKFKQIFYSDVDLALEHSQFFESLVGEILWRWSVVLHTFQITNDLFCASFLSINYAFQHVKLIVNLLCDLFLETLLVEDALLHVLALLKVAVTLGVNVFQLLDMLVRGLLQGECLAPLI